MQKHKNLINQYFQADVEHRLALFLENPSLRATFIRIDQNKYGQKKRRLEKSLTNKNIGKLPLLGQVKRIFQ